MVVARGVPAADATAVTDGFAGTLADAGVLLRMRRPYASPLLALPARRPASISAMSRRCAGAPGAGLAVAERRPAAGRWLPLLAFSGDQSLPPLALLDPAAACGRRSRSAKGGERRVATSGR